MTKNLYKSKRKMAKATPLQKSQSKKQLQINRMKKHIERLKIALNDYKSYHIKSQKLIGFLLKEERITKTELKKFITPKKVNRPSEVLNR